MRRLLVIACIGALLSACTGPPPGVGFDPIQASAKVEAAADRVEAVKGFAELLLPFLGESTQATIRDGLAVVERSIAAARVATDVGRQLAELDRARRETERIAGIVGVPREQ